VSHLEETWHHPYGEAWWWKYRAVGMFFSGSDWEIKGKLNGEILDENLLQSAQTRSKAHLPTGQ
jgi:hypothetical protein